MTIVAILMLTISVSCVNQDRKLNLCCSDADRELHQSLCYLKCPEGSNGIGPLCWEGAVMKKDRGVGLPAHVCRRNLKAKDPKAMIAKHGKKGRGKRGAKGPRKLGKKSAEKLTAKHGKKTANAPRKLGK